MTATLFAHLELIDAARDAQGVHANLAADPAGVLARLRQGVSTTEVTQEQGIAAVTLDEVVPLAFLARLVLCEWTPGDSFEHLVEVRVRAHPQSDLPAFASTSNPQHVRPHHAHSSRDIAPRHLERRPA